jgi:hypothetical protein
MKAGATMMTNVMDILEVFIKMLTITIYSYDFMNEYRMEPRDFSRTVKLTFAGVVAFSLNFLGGSIQAEPTRCGRATDLPIVKKSTFFSARMKIKAEAFKALFNLSAKLAMNCEGMETFKGLRLLAAGGAFAQLEDTKSSRGRYGALGGMVGAKMSAVCDVLNRNIILSIAVGFARSGERALALTQIAELAGKVKGACFIFDRGCISEEMLKAFAGGPRCAFRCKRGCDATLDRLGYNTDSIVNLYIHKRRCRVRVVKFLLPSGETEILATDLIKNLGTGDIKWIYSKRWGVETAFRTMKNQLGLESCTGTSELYFVQDFYITLTLHNAVAFGCLRTDREIKNRNKDKKLKYEQKTNLNMAVAVFKDYLVKSITSSYSVMIDTIRSMLDEASEFVVYIIPGRQFPHKIKHKGLKHPNCQKKAI